ncbi:flagellar hook capping FlgD N-terminal domain-containing protein [Kerstersia similis]|uniref:flagellar hook capping FlgD N-terminal domain-containing protein n=1 Tax=Kerstersia similis TaxID=206505 RepID=UPI0039F05413
MSTIVNGSNAGSVDSRSLAVSTAQASTNNLMADTQERFLTLLVTQMQNQDPLNPMDNAQVTSQIAQLSTVAGVNQLNTTLLALSGQLDVGQSMQAAALVGKDVLVPGSKVLLGGATGEDAQGQATPFGVDMQAPAAGVVVEVLDKNGTPVRRMDLGAQPVGVRALSWDGKDDTGTALPEGAYFVRVSATASDGSAVPAETLSYGQVKSVVYTTEGLRLDLGLAGQVSLFDIRQIM